MTDHERQLLKAELDKKIEAVLEIMHGLDVSTAELLLKMCLNRIGLAGSRAILTLESLQKPDEKPANDGSRVFDYR